MADGTTTDARRTDLIRQTIRPFIVWTGILLAGLALLYARYDWSIQGGHFAERAWLLSAYLFVLMLPTTYYLSRWLLASRGAAVTLTAVLFVVTTLPWDLLGLEGLYYYSDRPPYLTYLDVPPARQLAFQFFPDGTLYAFPYDFLFMPLLFAAGVAVVWGGYRLRARSGHVAARKIPILLTAAFAVICTQTYAHSSMRAPASYHPVLTKPEAKQNWYVNYHFKDGTGAVIADQFVFSALEQYFQADTDDPNNMLVRRPLSFYLVAQVSYFINTFYVWLGLNCLFWLGAVFAMGRWVTRVADPRAGLFAAALVTVSPGFLAWSATTAMYLQAFAVVIIALCLFEDLVVRDRGARLAGLALFASALAMCMLVYDLLPLAVSLLAYGIARGVRRAPLLLALGTAIIVSYAFPYLVTVVLDTPINDKNTRQLSRGIEATKDLFLQPSFQAWYSATTELLPAFVAKLLQAFFVVPVLLAIAAIPLLKDRALRVLVVSLLVTGFAVMAVLILGDNAVGRTPRMVYPVFPAVYLMAALALAAIKLPGRWRDVVPWSIIALMALLANFDVFGYPALYVEWFEGRPPRWKL